MRIDTDRLVLRRFRDDDLDGLAALNADPEVMRYIGAGTTIDRTETAERLAAMQRHWDEHGFGLFAVDWPERGVFTGWVGLATPTFLPEVLPAVEIGWRLARTWWGHGIATEAARAVLRFAFDEVGLDRLISIRHVDNAASGRVMEKLGFTFERTTAVPAHGQPVSVWELLGQHVPRGIELTATRRSQLHLCWKGPKGQDLWTIDGAEDPVRVDVTLHKLIWWTFSRCRASSAKDPIGSGWATASSDHRDRSSPPVSVMTVPAQYIEASEQFRQFLLDLRDTAALATTNQAFTIAEAVLRTFRRQLDVRQVARFAGVLPAVLRAIFIAGWDPDEPPRTFESHDAIVADLLTLRPLHNYASDTSVHDVAIALRNHVDEAKFDAVLVELGPAVASYWQV